MEVMTDGPPHSDDSTRRDGAFHTTRWSMVQRAGREDTPRAGQALEHLCCAYWYPLYAYVRRRGYAASDAQDLTQAFFARLIERRWVGNADSERGRFRTFLLTALSRFLADEWDKGRAQKRGGGVTHVPIQIETAETRYGNEPADHLTPEQCYERRWAVTLLENVLRRLRDEHEREGRAAQFDALHAGLVGDRQTLSYNQMAARLGISEGAARVAVHRLRKRYRQVLRDEIAQTLTPEEDVEEELRHLFAVLAG